MLIKAKIEVVAPLEAEAQFVEGAVHAHARGVFAELQFCADVGKFPALEKTQQHRLAVRCIQLGQYFVDHAAGALPFQGGNRIVGGIFLHKLGLLFPRLAAAFAAHGLGRRVSRAGEQPSSQHLVPGQYSGFAGQIGEDQLRDILRLPCVPAWENIPSAPERSHAGLRRTPREETSFREPGTVAGRVTGKIR